MEGGGSAQRNLHHALARFKDGEGGYKARSRSVLETDSSRQLKKTGASVRQGTELWLKSEKLVARSCPTLCDPMGCSLPCPLFAEFPRQEYWSGFPFPSPYNLNKSESGFIPRASRSAALTTAWFCPHEDSKQRTSWATPGPGIWHTDNTLCYLFFKQLFTSLAALGLSCGMQEFSFFF